MHYPFHEAGLFTDSFVPLIMRLYPGLVGDISGYLLYPFDIPLLHHTKSQQSNFRLVKSGVPLIVVVIGEASSPSFYSLYGASKKLTPELEKLSEEQKICAVKHAHSVANQTRHAVLPNLTDFSPQDRLRFLTQKSFFQLAHQAGYNSEFLTTANDYGGVYNGYTNFLAEEADVSNINYYSEQDDLNLINFLSQSLSKRPSGKKLIFLHMRGSHGPYQNKSDHNDKTSLSGYDAYAHTIHHTDKVLGKIFAILEKNASMEKRPFLFLYASDHGEDVKVHWHGIFSGGRDYPIPVIIGGDLGYCEKANKLRSANGWYSSLMNKYLIADALGYSGNQGIISSEQNKDLVLHVDGATYEWGHIPGQNLAEKINYPIRENK